MRKLFVVLVLLLLAQLCMAEPLNVQFQTTGFLNFLNAASIDPGNPSNQPLLFWGSVSNTTAITYSYSLKLQLQWNGNYLLDTYTEALQSLPPHGSTPNITNRDLINSVGSTMFAAPRPRVTFDGVLNASDLFKNTIFNTGRFPDGTYTFTIQAVTQDNAHSPLSTPAIFALTIRNANTIYLNRPGAVAGGNIPAESNQPVMFSWSSNISGLMNNGAPVANFTMTIREFNSAEDMQPSNIENGRLFGSYSLGDRTVFNEYLPFVSGKYYAWQISMPLSSGTTVLPTLKSSWYVFQFAPRSDTQQNPAPENEYVQYLNRLNKPQITNVLSSGFVPTGTVIVGNETFTGSSSLQILRSLAGKTITNITITDN